MPFGDKTGPRGTGMSTGRGMGYCTSNRDTRYFNQVRVFGRRAGQGRRCTGRGSGSGRNYFG